MRGIGVVSERLVTGKDLAAELAGHCACHVSLGRGQVVLQRDLGPGGERARVRAGPADQGGPVLTVHVFGSCGLRKIMEKTNINWLMTIA